MTPDHIIGRNSVDVTSSRYLLSDFSTGTGISLFPGPLFVRILLWAVVLALCPLSVTAARLSFKIEVLGCKTLGLGQKVEVAPRVTLAQRVLVRLEDAEKHEPDPWLRDDIRIAWITVLEADRGSSQPHIDATYRVLGCHPDAVFPNIVARRQTILGASYESFFPEASSPKKPVESVRDPRGRKRA